MESAKTFIVVPAFNEATVIEQTLRDLSTLPYDIIIVDDGSTDDIKSIVRNYAAIFISHAVNLGQGAALQTGMELAKKMDAEIVIHFDADGQHAASDINKLIKPITNNECDIVFGSRFLNKQSSQNIPLVKKIVLKIARYVNWFYTGILLSDAHNGLRALNKKAVNAIIISENKMAHASEILYLTKKNNLRYKEVPVTIKYTSYSQKKGQGILNSINILIHLIFKKIDS